MDLIIVESPTKAKTLGKFLGDKFVVDATMGHLKDLPKSTLGIDVEKNFAPEYVEVIKRADTIKKLISESKNANTIYLASDPDREGEAIAQHIVEVLRSNGKFQISNDKFKRISFHEITKEAVTEALQNPRDIDTNLVDAQIARRVLDRLVGYKLSPVLWKKVRVGLSAGRVQSVAVRLIVEKEREIEKFKSDEYWEVWAKVIQVIKVKQVAQEFTVQLVKIGDKIAEVKNKAQADEILKDLEKAKYTVSDIRKRQVVKSPYAPFTTSTLTQAGSRIFGWSSKKTMAVAQKLYEEGIITYHRTDSLNLSAQAIQKAREFIAKEYGEKYIPEKPRIYKTNSKVAQEAHEAIRPTDSTKYRVLSTKYSNDESRLYDLIWRRFVSCQMASAIMDETTIDVSAANYLLRTGGQVMKFDGWRKVLPVKKDGESTDVILPDVIKGEDLSLVKIWGDQKFTQPPPRFNEASLIKTLEKLGIGRPSTYAPTISTIQVRQYVEKNEGKFKPTSIGFAVTDFLVSNFPKIFDYDFTAGMEDDLDNIANGKHEWESTIKDFYGPFEKKVTDVTKNSERVKIEVEKLGQKCPDCKDGELVIRTGRFGKFISCSLFPECKYTAKFLEKVGVICPDCKEGDVIVKKTSKGRKFFGCSRYPDCKYASWHSPKKEDENENKES